MLIFSNRITQDNGFYWCRGSVFGQTGDIFWEGIEMEDTPENRTYLRLKRDAVQFYDADAISVDKRISGIHMYYPERLKAILESCRKR